MRLTATMARINEKFTKWMDSYGITDLELATLIHVDRSHIYRMRKGTKRPSLPVAVKLEKVSFGKVPTASWCTDEELALT